MNRPTYYEFFAGGGMARAGLGSEWRCLLANDFDAKKASAYRANWGDADFRLADIAALTPADLPGAADLAWASFPCQDLSLAGAGKGLKGERSGTFYSFVRLMKGLREEGRAPRVIALENVVGLLTSHGGSDFISVVRELVALGYRVGSMVIDAVHFVPQSRPRVFFVAVRNDIAPPVDLACDQPVDWCTNQALATAAGRLKDHAARHWIWWRLPAPTRRNSALAEVIEAKPVGVAWHSPVQTAKILSMMSDRNRNKVTLALSGGRHVGTVYRRTRPDRDGVKHQRAEVRFDGVAGCLRTPEGGSSRQTLMIVERGKVRTRLLSPREAARLMGLPDSYELPERYNEAYHLLGDGVAVPAVRYLAEHLVRPLLAVRAGVRVAAE